ncbi:MAG: response regulator [Chthoniobacter sp.]
MGKGTGLGLATVIGIVKSHGGFLTVQSELGVGTTFSVFLPASQEAQTTDAAKEEIPIERGKGELILVVDDEPGIREALVRTLSAHGYRAYTAEDGSDALALYFQRRAEIKLVITDLAMGQMDGVTLVRSLRKVDPRVKVIVSSGHMQKENVVILEGHGREDLPRQAVHRREVAAGRAEGAEAAVGRAGSGALRAGSGCL